MPRPDLTYLSPDTEIRDSPIHGKGLFARRAITAGTVVAVKGGYIFTVDDWEQREQTLGPAHIQIAEDLVIGPSAQDERDGNMIYTNHSCDPNIAIQGQITFVAMRDIAPGEELTHDWATTDDREYDEVECHCGASSCRGLVTGKDWMKPDLQLSLIHISSPRDNRVSRMPSSA